MSSTVIAKNVQIGADGTASNNFTIFQPATPDGTLRIGNGNTGITASLVAVTSAGNVGIGTSSPSTYGKFGVVSGANFFGVASGTYNSASFGPRPANDGFCSINYYWGSIGSGNFWVNDFTSGGVDWVRYSGGVSSGVLMRIDSSGNVGIGTSSVPSDAKVAISGTGLVLQDASGAIQRFNKTLGTDTGWLSNRSYGWHDGNGLALSTSTADALKFGTNNTERARIDSSGNLLVGTTSVGGGFTSQVRQTVEAASGSNGAQILINNAGNTQWTQWIWNKGTSGDGLLMQFGTEGIFTARGSILYNRGSGVVAYNTTSDYRAKDISGPVVNALSTVAQLKPWLGTMKGATVERPMFVAHETQAVAPYAVTGEKDAVNDNGEPVYQQMDHSTLVPLLTAAIQEQQAIITALTARVTALEGTQP